MVQRAKKVSKATRMNRISNLFSMPYVGMGKKVVKKSTILQPIRSASSAALRACESSIGKTRVVKWSTFTNLTLLEWIFGPDRAIKGIFFFLKLLSTLCMQNRRRPEIIFLRVDVLY
jgi:hypothetical protein